MKRSALTAFCSHRSLAELGSAVILILAGCGGNRSTTTPEATLSVTCLQACTVTTGQNLQLSATVTGLSNQSVSWVVDGSANGNRIVGTISNSGLYTAPEFSPAGGTVSVKATAADGVTSGKITLTITQGILPTFVAYTNDGCPTCTTDVERVYVFDESNPGVQIQVSPDDSPSRDVYPAISPDKRTVAYIKQTQTSSLYTANTEGGSTPTLIKSWSDPSFVITGVDWDPSGTGFALTYIDSSNGLCGVETLSLDGKSVNTLLMAQVYCPKGSGTDHPPASPRYYSDWRIAYTASGRIAILSADGHQRTDITITGITTSNVTLSPDGTNYAFDGPNGTYTIDFLAGPILIAPGGFPAWCPGNAIVFTDNGNLYSISSWYSGAIPSQLTTWSSSFPYCR